ncbi:UNVERIFIED_CONTAM: hypothetical protein PYX00_009323 [Menopon gallinae]|uniref:Homeobox domain-containing protein n=1 Tax=Menopon gallinae TaxID=328185 RepID=A0AAW2HAM6_9NEOP
MVISTLHDLKKSEMDSQSLKFGMDRILSEEISPKNHSTKELPCTSTPPCADCLTSLYRCCRNSTFSSAAPNFYKTVIHAPQPLRPYTNVLVKPDSSNHPVPVQQPTAPVGNSRRKRSWSRAVFSNLQRKGLEKRFQLQKYITKPDRRQLAATLGLSDAQVKVWFQNRRMKWRHTKEAPRQNFINNDSGENGMVSADSTQIQQSDSDCGSDIDVQTIDS